MKRPLILAAVVPFVTLAGIQVVHTLRVHRYGALAPICRVETRQRVIGLSFDDGPTPEYTPRVLRLLKRYDVRATFFVIGARTREYPGLVRREVEAGMEVGVHTWTHPHLPSLSSHGADVEIAGTREYLVNAQRVRPHLFRPPFGEITPDQLRLVKEAGLRTVDWSLAVDHVLADANLSPHGAAESLMSEIQPGDILLVHDSGAGAGPGRRLAIRTLELLLPRLMHARFRLTALSTLLRTGSPIVDQPRTWFWQRGFTCPSSHSNQGRSPMEKAFGAGTLHDN